MRENEVRGQEHNQPQATHNSDGLDPCSICSPFPVYEVPPRVEQNVPETERKRANGVEEIQARQDRNSRGHTDITVR